MHRRPSVKKFPFSGQAKLKCARLTDDDSATDALNSSLEYGEGSSPKQKKSDGGGEYIEDDEMEWRKSAKSALQQQRPPKTYKVRQYLCVICGYKAVTIDAGKNRFLKSNS